jgi:hypothetical protein
LIASDANRLWDFGAGFFVNSETYAILIRNAIPIGTNHKHFINYNGNPIAAITQGQSALLQCDDKKMVGDVTI